MTPSVSVVIPVFRNPEGLRQCLDALASQSYGRDRFEVVVVDNGDNGDLAIVAAYPRVRVVSERTPSSYAARNRGIAEATGEVLAFTDADCRPQFDWIERGVAALTAQPTPGLVGGRVEVEARTPSRPGMVESYDRVVFHRQQRLIAERGFATTANLFVWSAILRQIGGFDPGLRSGGDRELGNRAVVAGFPLTYAGDACVRHPALRSFRDLRHKVRRVLGGELGLKRRQGYPRSEMLADFYRDAVAPLSAWRVARREPLIDSPGRAAGFVTVATYARTVRIFERIRLLAGGEPCR